MRVRFVVLVLLLAAPVKAAFRCPARGGTPWREYRTAHFLIDTDAKPSEVQSLVRQLEHMQALLLQGLLGEQIDIPGRVRVLAFADQGDFTEMAGDVYAAYYGQGSFDEPTIVLPLRLLRESPESVAHEVAHHLSFFLFPVQPAWFSEGLAEWVATVASRPNQVRASTGSHIVSGASTVAGGMAGSIPFNLVSWLSYDGRPMPIKELFAWNGSETITSGARGHLWGWVLYHWLWNHRSKALAEYQKRLADSADPGAAWKQAFPEFDPGNPEAMSKLETELDRYRKGGRFAAFKVTAEADGRFTESALSSSDLHLLMLGARRQWPPEKDRSLAARRAILGEAVGEDPGNPAAVYLQMKALEKVDVAALRAAVNARPADWRGWLLLGQAGDPAEREAALRKAVQLNPDNATAQNELAWRLATSDRAREALPIANRALDLAPWNAALVDTLAEVAARLGKCSEARQLEKRAVATVPTDQMRERQADIERRCSGGK